MEKSLRIGGNMTKCDLCANDNKCTLIQRSECAVRDYLYFVPEYDADSEFVAIEKVLRECGKSPGYLAAVLMEKGLRVKR